MDNTTHLWTDEVSFWDGYAKWHKLWFEHNSYHQPILKTLMNIVKPGWRVLEIGAGNGVLSIPLAALDCQVTIMEPSTAMRSLFFKEAFKRGIDSIEVECRKWEEVPVFELMGYDLIMACNSLHLPETGFQEAFDKVFRADPAHVFLVTEHIPQSMIRFAYQSHVLRFARTCDADDSFAYHKLNEVFECQRYEKGRKLSPVEENALIERVRMRDDHYWLDATTKVGMYWFDRRDSSLDPNTQ